MAVDDGQDNSPAGSRVLTVNKSASSKQSSSNTRSHSRSSSSNTNRRGMIPSEAQQRVMSNSLGGGIIRIALSPSSTPRESPFASPKPSRTNTTNSTTPDPGPSVAARDASNNNKKKNTSKGGASSTLPNTTYTNTVKKKAPTPSQYSPSIYNGGSDWAKAPSPPLPLPTLAATTYSPRSAKKNQTSLNDTSKSKSKGATSNAPKQLTIKNLDYDPELEPKPLSTPRMNREKMKIDPRDEKDRIVGMMKEKPLPARPDPSKVARKKTIKDISVPVSPAGITQPSLGTAAVASQPIQATKMVKIKTKQVARRQPQVVQVQGPSTVGVSGGASNTGKVATLARTKSRITRIMSFGGTPAPAPALPTSNAHAPTELAAATAPDEGAGGGWWDMLDNILLGPLKPPPRPAAVTQPALTKKAPEMRSIGGGGGLGGTSSKQGVFDPKNLI